MSRPTKQGISYFPLDVQFDDKVELLIADKGSDALSVLVTTWQLIYQNEGYYVEDGSDLYLLIRRRIMTEKTIIQDIVIAAIGRGIFDKSMHKNHKILTSKAIQKRYFIASARKKIINVYKNYLLVEVNEYKNVNCLGVNVCKNATKEEEEEEEEGDIKEEGKKQQVFDSLWNDYPKKDGRKAALKHFNNSVKNEEDEIRIKKALENYKTSVNGTDPKFVKNGSTWFNNWQDWIDYKPVEIKTKPGLMTGLNDKNYHEGAF